MERESKHSKPNSNPLNEIQIRTIRKGFEAFECKFEPFEIYSKHLNVNSNDLKGIRSIRIQIRTIWKEFEALDRKFEPFERNWRIRMQIQTIRKGIEAFECKYLIANTNHSKGIWSIRMQIRTIRKGFKPVESHLEHSIANLNHSKKIRSIPM